MWLKPGVGGSPWGNAATASSSSTPALTPPSSWQRPPPGGADGSSPRPPPGNGRWRRARNRPSAAAASSSLSTSSWQRPPLEKADKSSPRPTPAAPHQAPSWLRPSLGEGASSSSSAEARPSPESPRAGAERRSRSPESRAQPAAKRPIVDLTLGSVILAAHEAPQTKHAEHGASTQRVAQAMREPCRCRVCERGLLVPEVTEFCTYYHRLSYDQMSVMLSMCPATGECVEVDDEEDGAQRPSSDMPPANTRSLKLPSRYAKFKLLGRRICRPRLLKILGVSARTFEKHRHGAIDKRVFSGRAIEEQTMTVDQFVLEMWLTAAEGLPEDPALDAELLLGEEPPPLCADCSDSESASTRPLDHVPHWDPGSNLLHEMSALGGQRDMRRKYIQHQTITDLWWQYVAWHAERCPVGLPRASYTSFWRRWRDTWSDRLKTRKSSQHAQCTICSGYSNYIHHARGSPEDKQLSAKRWHEHLKDQYRDRLIYWNIRQASRRSESNVLSIIIDSMDKTKCAWPQYTFQKNKEIDKWRRPRVVITCVMAHGYCCDFYLADDEEMFHGASTFCEILTRTLSRVQDICAQRGVTPPEHLVVQSDNTTAQAKNAEVQKFLAILVRKFKFHTVVLTFVRVGRAYEDVDQMFAVFLTLVLRRIRFQRPEELRKAIEVALREVVEARGEKLQVALLTHIRNFAAWMNVVHVSVESCFVARGGIDVPHSFTYKFRMDLTHVDIQRLQADMPRNAKRFAADPLDVFCVTKHFMSSTETSPPMLLIPNERFGRLSLAPSGSCYVKNPITEGRKAELVKLAEYLEEFTAGWKDAQSYFRAAQDLREMATGRDARTSFDNFLMKSARPRTTPVATCDNVYFGNLPATCWRMRIAFGR